MLYFTSLYFPLTILPDSPHATILGFKSWWRCSGRASPPNRRWHWDMRRRESHCHILKRFVNRKICSIRFIYNCETSLLHCWFFFMSSFPRTIYLFFVYGVGWRHTTHHCHSQWPHNHRKAPSRCWCRVDRRRRSKSPHSIIFSYCLWF